MRWFERIIIIILFVGIFCCKKDDPEPSINLTFKVVSDAQRLLSWNDLKSPDGYTVWRITVQNGKAGNAEKLATVNQATIEYMDADLPVVGQLQYYVTGTANNKEVKSNVVSGAGGAYFPILPYQVKLLPDKNLAVIRGYSEIYLIDYEKMTLIKRKEFSGQLGTFDIGTYNGRKEMYLPSTDHNLYILDPYDFSSIAVINGNYPIASAAVNSVGKIFFSDDEYNGPLKVFNRTDLSFVSKNPGQMMSGIRLQSDNTIVSISNGLSPATMIFYTFDSQGKLIKQKEDPYGYDYEMDPMRMDVSSSFIVTSTQGFVYNANENLTWVGTLLPKTASNLADFEFGADGITIYSAPTTSKGVMKSVYNGSQFNSASSIQTAGYPWMLARNGDEMIVLSSPFSFSQFNVTNKIIVERISLK